MNSAQEDFAHAVRLRNEGNSRVALEILTRLAQSPDATAAVHTVLGDLHWDANELSQAIAAFQKATELAPASECASLGLFHTLMESDRDGDAFDEMRRFLGIAESTEYAALLHNILNSSEKS